MNLSRIDSIIISDFTEADTPIVSQLIRDSIAQYDQSAVVISAIMRRVEKLSQVYSREGNRFFVAHDTMKGGAPVACAGIGSLHGLPISEGMGELRDLVVNPEYRGIGLGAKLINTCVEKCKQIGYNRLYLETTPQMKVAQKLFLRTGFRPVTDTSLNAEAEDVPSYFIMENL